MKLIVASRNFANAFKNNGGCGRSEKYNSLISEQLNFYQSTELYSGAGKQPCKELAYEAA
jgi:hypothetical protein